MCDDGRMTYRLLNENRCEVPLVNQQVFSAVVVMVIVTTVLTPPALKWSFERFPGSRDNSPARHQPAAPPGQRLRD